ncbi:hypothetical protein KKG45_02435 [bacterium]|nr:hypothetical protein [bacterium]MBU1072081.1 hypothetical protein [bacterium]MBU1674852.1 hypothetical protein [bacterium]
MRAIAATLMLVLSVATPVAAGGGASAAAADSSSAGPSFVPLSSLTPAYSALYRAPTPVNATAAVYMTPVFPGWGQLYSDNGWRAVLAFGAEMWFWSRMLMYDRKAVRLKLYEAAAANDISRAFYHDQIVEYWELMRDNAWWSGGALLIIAVDAYVDAHLHRFDQDPVPVPDDWDPGAQPQPIELPHRAAPVAAMTLGWTAEF